MKDDEYGDCNTCKLREYCEHIKTKESDMFTNAISFRSSEREKERARRLKTFDAHKKPNGSTHIHMHA